MCLDLAPLLNRLIIVDEEVALNKHRSQVLASDMDTGTEKMKKELADSNFKVDYLEEELFKTNQRVADMEKRLGDLSLEGNNQLLRLISLQRPMWAGSS